MLINTTNPEFVELTVLLSSPRNDDEMLKFNFALETIAEVQYKYQLDYEGSDEDTKGLGQLLS